MRVLHVLRALDMGGIQRWVVNLAEVLRERGVVLDVLYLVEPVDDHLVRVLTAAGGNVLGPAPSSYDIPKLYRFLRGIQRTYGPYNAVHAHLFHNSGLYLSIFRSLAVPVRIHHVHSVMTRPDMRLDWTNWRRWARAGLRGMLRAGATHRLAVSVESGQSMHGRSWGHDRTDAILPPGIEAPYLLGARDRTDLRREFGIPVDAKVVGHVGRFVEVKNHPKLLSVFAAYARRDRTARLILVGDGPLRENIVASVNRLGLQDRVTLLGVRADATRVMQIFDVLVLPSVSESFGLVAAEAISVGVPVVASDGVPAETFPPALAYLRQRLSLQAPGDVWADAIESALSEPQDPERASVLFASTRLDVRHGADELAGLYRGD